MVAVDPHGTVAVVAVERATGRIDRDQVVVDAEAVALGIPIGEQPSLQHLVRRETDAGHDVGRIERRLLDFGKIILGVPVQLQDTDLHQRIILVEPDLGQVEGMVGALRRGFLRHHLDEHRPTREVLLLDAFVQVALVAFPAFADHRFGLRVGQVLDALLGAEVELDPEPLVAGVEQAEGVAAETVHVAVGGGNPPVAHHDGDLVQRLRQRGPEVPVVEGAAQVGAGVALDRMVEVGELERVAQEEHRRVVADQVPIALVGVELDREAADVALRVGRPPLAGHGREAHEAIGLLAHRSEDRRLGEPHDVVGDGEGAVGSGAFGVHPPLGNHLPVEMGQFLQEPDILQQCRASRAGGHDVLVVDNGRARVGGQLLLLGRSLGSFHGASSLRGEPPPGSGDYPFPAVLPRTMRPGPCRPRRRPFTGVN